MKPAKIIVLLIAFSLLLSKSQGQGSNSPSGGYWYTVVSERAIYTGRSPLKESDFMDNVLKGGFIILDDLRSYESSNGKTKYYASSNPRVYINSKYIIHFFPLRGDPAKEIEGGAN